MVGGLGRALEEGGARVVVRDYSPPKRLVVSLPSSRFARHSLIVFAHLCHGHRYTLTALC